MFNKRMAWIVVGALLYSALALVVLAPTSIFETAGERLPGPLAAILLSVAGPVALFAEGIDAWPVVAVVAALIGICLVLSRLAWRKFPETEWFVLWLLCAALVWTGSPWLLVVFGI